MTQKRVTFEVAKALKEAGYPQGDKNSGDCDVYPLEDHDDNYTPYTRIGKITTRYRCETWRILSSIPYAVAPTYLDAWLWIEKETDILIDSECVRGDTFVGYRYMVQYPSGCVYPKYKFECSPYRYLTREEAIEAAIKYIVNENILK